MDKLFLIDLYAGCDLMNWAEIVKRAAFDTQIKIICGDSFTVPTKEHTPNPQYPWDEEDHPIPTPEADAMDEKDTLLLKHLVADTLINAKVVFTCGDSYNLAEVIWRYIGVNEKFISDNNEYPIQHLH